MNETTIPNALRTRRVGITADHEEVARQGFETIKSRTADRIKQLDIYMAEREETMDRLRREQVADRHELEAAERAHKAAQRAIAELDGVAP